MEVPNAEADYHSPNKVFHVGHLYWYNPETLTALAIKNGFSVVDLQIVPGTMHLNMVMRKDAQEKIKSFSSNYVGNYEKMRSFFEKRTVLAHYLSKTPYSRFLRKMWKYAGEYRYVKKYNDKIELIKSVSRKSI